MEDSTEILQLGGPHLKTCGWCGIEFYGRKNQKYCSEKHKAAVNNEKRSELNGKLSPWFRAMTISYNALRSSLNQRDENHWIKTSLLTAKGFDPDVAAKSGTSKDGKQFKVLFDLAYYFSVDKQFVQCIKMKKIWK